MAHTISAPHHACACCPHIHAYLLPSSSHGLHSRCPSHASAFQHVTTCRAFGSGAQWRPVISPFDCSVLSWRPIHPGQLKPTTLPLRRLAPDSCSVGLSPTLSLTFSPALSPAPHSLSLSSLLLLSDPLPLRPTLSLSLSLSLSPSRPKRGGSGRSVYLYLPRGSSWGGGGDWHVGRAMRERILGSHTPPCHRRMVFTTLFSVLPCCTAAQASSVPLQVVADCALALAICTFGSARTHHPPTVPVSL